MLSLISPEISPESPTKCVTMQRVYWGTLWAASVFGFQGQLTSPLTMQTLLLRNHIKISFHRPFTTEWLRQLLAFKVQHYVFIQHNRNRSAFKLLYFLIPILLISLAALSCCRQWCKPVSWTGSILRLWKGTKNISGIILTAPFSYFLWCNKEIWLVPPTASVSSFVISYFFGCALFAPLSSASVLKVNLSMSVFIQSKNIGSSSFHEVFTSTQMFSCLTHNIQSALVS